MNLGALFSSPFDDEVGPACDYCGEPSFVRLAEAWGRDFQLDTCCLEMNEAACTVIAQSPREAAAWLNASGLGGLHGGARRVVDDGLGASVIDWNLRLDFSLDFATVKRFILQHHRHCKPPAGWRFGAGLRNGNDLVA